MTKVCFLAHNLRHDNGAGVFSRRIIEGVKSHSDYDVTVLTVLPCEESYARHLLSSKFKILRNFFKIRRVFKRANIIHAMDVFPYGFIAVFFSFGLRKKIIITAIGSGSIIPLYKRIYSFLSRYCYRRANCVTAISHFVRNEILKKTKNVNIKIIMPGVDFEKFNRDIYEGNPRKLNLPRNYVLSVGSLRWRKGYKVSIPAFAKVNAIFPEMNYVIVGKKYTEKQYDKLQGLIGDSELENKVHILHNVDNFDELVNIYKNAELFLLMSQNKGHDVEGFGMVFLEAAACGLPVVGSKDCGVEEAILEDGNGFLVGERDVDGFANAVIKILSDEQLKSSMSQQSLVFAKSQSWDSKVNQYVDVYKSIS